MSDDIKENILSPGQWIRIAFMALFAVICWLLTMIYMIVIGIQIIFSLVTGQSNENLLRVTNSLNTYLYQILKFLTYNSDLKPFPFTPLPDGDGKVDDEPQEAEAVVKETAEETAEETASQDAQEAESSQQESEEEPYEAPSSNTQAEPDDVFADISFTPNEDSDEGSSAADAQESDITESSLEESWFEESDEESDEGDLSPEKPKTQE